MPRYQLHHEDDFLRRPTQGPTEHASASDHSKNTMSTNSRSTFPITSSEVVAEKQTHGSGAGCGSYHSLSKINYCCIDINCFKVGWEQLRSSWTYSATLYNALVLNFSPKKTVEIPTKRKHVSKTQLSSQGVLQVQMDTYHAANGSAVTMTGEVQVTVGFETGSGPKKSQSFRLKCCVGSTSHNIFECNPACEAWMDNGSVAR